MKLYWSPRSPFVRKVVIVAHELGRSDALTLERAPVAMTEVNAALSACNPLNKLPTLVLDGGTILYDSSVICEFLDEAGILHPTDRMRRLDALRRQALGDGLLEMLVLWRNERSRPLLHQSPPHLAAWEAKVQQTLNRLEHQVADFAALPFDIGHVAIGCAVGYVDFRFAALNWRATRPALADWTGVFEARRSAQATRAGEG